MSRPNQIVAAFCLALSLGLIGCEAPSEPRAASATPELTAEAARDALVEAANTNPGLASFVFDDPTEPGRQAHIRVKAPNVVQIGDLTVNLGKHIYEYTYRCGGLDGKCGTMLTRRGHFEFADGRWIVERPKF